MIAEVAQTPQGWEECIEDLGHVMGWGPDAAWGMTWTETLRRVKHAQRIHKSKG